jgi:hypothetical protein
MGGIVATDRLLGNKYGKVLRDRFEHALETEFTNSDGTILPIRSELTGFTVRSFFLYRFTGKSAVKSNHMVVFRSLASPVHSQMESTLYSVPHTYHT